MDASVATERDMSLYLAGGHTRVGYNMIPPHAKIAISNGAHEGDTCLVRVSLVKGEHDHVKMILIVEGFVMCFVLLLVCVIGIANGPVGLVVFYGQEVKNRAIETQDPVSDENTAR